jgi:SNF2 family DNA or RNA helicase
MRGGLSKRDEAQYQKVLDFRDGLRIFSFNVEALSRDGKARDLFEMALGSGTGVMVAIDESSDCIKNYEAKRTKYVIKYGSHASYRRILTGTQSPEGRADELFPQYKNLDEDIFGLDTITAFRARYCQEIKMEVDGREVITFSTDFKYVEELRQRIEGHSYRVRRADCMELPPKVYKRWPVEMSKEQRRIYEELRDEYTTIHAGKTLSAALAMTRAMRLQQIICGWFPMDEAELIDGETWRKIIPIEGPNQRMDALDDILRTNEDQKVIIWARFRPDLERIQAHLGERAVSYHGGIKNDQKAKNYRAFQHDKNIQYLVANQSSAGRGLTLTAATLLLYYSNSFRLVDRLQSEDRAEGDEKKKESTLVIDIEACSTVDTKIIRALRRKKDVADLINGDPKSLFMEITDDTTR